MTKILKVSLLLVAFCLASPVSAQAHSRHHGRHHHHVKQHRVKHKPKKIVSPIVPAPVEEPPAEPTPPPTPMPLTRVSSCGGPESFCPAIYEFPWYGNDEVGDCQFAAAADWEILTQGVTPSEPEVLEAYYQSENHIQPYWETHPIDGITTALTHKPYRRMKITTTTIINGEKHITETYNNPIQDDALMESLIAQNTAVYVILNLGPSETHAVIADGYTPTGPLLATWARTYQITWQAWNEYVISMETLTRR